MKMEIVGKGPGGEPVIDGEWVAWAMDTYGLGVAEYRQMLESRGMLFSIRGFIEEGLRLQWDPYQIINKIMDNAPVGLSRWDVQLLTLRLLTRYNDANEAELAGNK